MQVLEIVRPSSPTEDFRGQYGELNCYSSIRGAIEAEASNDSVHLFFPDVLQDKAAEFLTGFRGRSMYAVKANPHAEVLKTLYTAGVRDFDVASIREVELVAGLLPGAKLYFMHPIKSRQAIQRAYMMGVRAFAFDHMDELNKILEETGYAEDLELFLRLGVSAKGAAYELSGKFGAPLDMAPMLLSRARQVAMKLGVSFHVGSQCMRPGAFSEAILQAAAVVGHAGIKLDVIDVGGGFPVAYPGMEPPALDSYFQTIHSALDMHGFADAETLCEPGRALVAESGAVAARVELRKGTDLYLNDGTYGALFDAGVPEWPFPLSLVTADGRDVLGETSFYRCFGPTCDSCDKMEGPFPLPVDVAEGDWVIFEHLGAYGHTMQARFNGFYSETMVAISRETDTPNTISVPTLVAAPTLIA
ncbi:MULTISPECIES: type III PLP-dependent enzyme [Kordiimonas]|jgi:ornithine decarboxylase|uniref:type III PLP-dependent enzyme n=1 Tax=Kordiimonas TaxID=288021 RepID=UPI002579CD98|nr:type III PLP-dependent enzyme [Kordiimonas sp. UBA4487]